MVLPSDPKAVHNPETGVSAETLTEVGKASVQTPSGFVRTIPLRFAISD